MRKLLLIIIAVVFVGVASFIPAKNDWDKVNSKAQLGKLLFNEKILSWDSTVSCASCHIPQFAFADTATFSKGINQTLTTRNTPSVLNMLNRTAFFWDGRASSLEEQALKPIEHKNEMGLPIPEAVKRLNAHPKYKKLFLKIFKQPANESNLAIALAAFERTLETVDSKFDDWTNDIRKNWTASEERGRLLFVGNKAKCFNCHFAEDFTGDEFKNIGLYNERDMSDVGRYAISQRDGDKGKFKVPGLRNVAVTAPYMHNGKFKTLEQVVAYYNNPTKFITDSKGIDIDLQQPLGLTQQEEADLVAFLKTLTDKKYLPKQP